jgi:uncharacterized membrane protein
MNKTVFGIILGTSIAIAVYAIIGYVFLTPGRTVHPSMMEAYAAYPWRILIHVFASLVALAIGPFQFIPSVRRHKTLHRTLGSIYFVAVFIGGISGLFTATIAQGGIISQVGFLVLASLWMITAGLALRAIKLRDYKAHEEWAMRCFALTFAAVTIRVQLGIGFATGHKFEDFYWMLSWTCWIPNLIFAEWLIRRNRLSVKNN